MNEVKVFLEYLPLVFLRDVLAYVLQNEVAFGFAHFLVIQQCFELGDEIGKKLVASDVHHSGFS